MNVGIEVDRAGGGGMVIRDGRKSLTEAINSPVEVLSMKSHSRKSNSKGKSQTMKATLLNTIVKQATSVSKKSGTNGKDKVKKIKRVMDFSNLLQ